MRLDRRKLRAAAGILLAWTVFGLFFSTQDLTRKLITHDPTPWWHYLGSWLVGVYLCAAFTPVILWLGRRFPFEPGKRLRRTALHLALSVVFSIVQLTVESAILPRLGLVPEVMKSFSTTLPILFLLGFHGNIVSYWLVLGIQSAFHYYHQYQERRRQALQLELQASELKTRLVQAQLSALKGQLQPHFLFNTLNAIMVLVRQEKGRQAEEMLARLSDLLRSVLEEVEAQEVPLRRELEYLDLYLSIEQVRFQDRLRVEIAADPETLDAAVPHLALQPLVENAVRHGIGRRSAAGRLQISAEKVNGSLVVQVRDDGPGLPAGGTDSRGIGLMNTRSRLQQLYGDAAKLTVENGPQGGAVATMTLPFRIEPGAATATAAMEVLAPHALDHAGR
ncbi:MAG TPA: histidine kinase [Thermoanaerobaculia bacterium]|nr:histidine kinase [Thermoanaerobaculia bacterium]